MEVIATTITPKTKNKPSKCEWGYIIVAGVCTLILCSYLFIKGGGVFAILLLLFYVVSVGKIFSQNVIWSKLPFVAFIDKGALCFDYVKRDNNGIKHNIKMSIELNNIDGYTLHSFFGQRPAMLELQEQKGALHLAHYTVPLEELSDTEYQKLIYFLEKLLPNKRKGVDEGKETHQKLISL